MRSVEERIDRLEAALTLLAEAQTRTEERLGRLETAVERLAEAQRRTEVALQNLAQAVGRLSDTLGYGLEDIARVILPGYLERHLGIRVGTWNGDLSAQRAKGKGRQGHGRLSDPSQRLPAGR